MAVSLRSLRVDASFDASAYTRGAAQKTNADARMIAADKAFAASQAQIAEALIATGNRLGSYSDALNDNSRAMAQITANNVEAGKGFAITGIEVANTANHLKTAAIAAYALSPAFRGLVNPAITASFRAMGPAAVAAGGAALSAFGPVIATVGRLALPIAIAVESFRAMAAITELGAEKLKEFNELAGKSAGAGVSTGFFQQQAAGAKEFGIEANLATEALKKFNEVSREQLGGSAFNQRLDQLTTAGNFQGNPGVAALQQATDTQSRYRAVVDLITVATDQGQRLAALDLASKFLPPELLERLRTSGSTLKELQATADAIKPADIVGPEDIGYALELKRRLDAANEVIANKFKPVQKDLTQLGLNYQESWVNITEIMAGAVTKGNDLYSALKGIPGLLAQAGNASFWTKLTDYTGKLGLNSDPASLGLIMEGQPGYNDDTARNALGAQLRNQSAVRQAMLQATAVQTSVRGDTSINPGAPAAASATANDAVDRAINSLRRHTEQQIADTNAMGLGVAELARFRAEAALTSAVQANGGKITADQAAQFEILKTRATDAALALEKAKIGSQVQFGRATSLLSPEDVAIAQQLKSIYPDVATALDSVQASGMRTNAALSGLSSSISGTLTSGLADIADGTKSIGQGAGDMSKLFARALEEMIIKMYVVIPLMRALQSIVSSLGFGGGSEASALASGIMPVARGAAFAGGNVIPFARGGVVSRPTLFPMASGTGLMGEAGPEAVMPLRRGSDGRLGVSASGGGGAGSAPTVAVNVQVMNYGNDNVSVKQKQNSNGGLDLEVMVGQAAANQMANPGSALRRVTDHRGVLARR